MSAPLHRFHAWGLAWESTLPLLPYPALSTEDAPDARVVADRIVPPSSLEADGLVHLIDARRCIIDLPRIARFDVRDGYTIIGQPLSDDVDAVSVFLRADAVPILLHQRGLFGVTGSGIILPNGKAVLFSGISGSGKSTLAAAFALRGCSVLSDQIALIRLDAAGVPEAVGDYPHLELWADSAAALGIDQKNLTPIRAGLQKYAWRTENKMARCAAPIQAIFHLKPANRAQIDLTEIIGVKKLLFLLHSIYKRGLAQRLGRISAYWETAAMIAESIRLFEVERPIEGSGLDALIHLIEETWTP